MRTAVKNAADPKQVKAAADADRQRAEQEVADLRALMTQPAGRRFMRRLVHGIAGLQRSTYVNGPTGKGSDQTFLEGMRNVGLTLVAELEAHCPEQWLLAIAEHYEALARDARKPIPTTTTHEDD